MTSMRPVRIVDHVSQAGRAILRSLVVLTAAGLCLGPAAAARAQVEGSSGKSLGSVSFYGLASADRNQFRKYENFPKTLGYTVGMSVDHRGRFGFTLEASAIKWRAQIHDYTAVGGPKVSFRVGRFRPYAEGLVGLGRGSYVVLKDLPAVRTTQTFGLAYGVAGGLDLRVTHHFTWRVVQANFTHLSVGQGVTTQTGSTGILFRY